MEKSIKVFIADDHQMVVEGLKLLLNEIEEIDIVGEANDGNSLLAKLPQNKPDIIILDVNMPGLNGIEITKKLKKESPSIKILILTMYSEGGIIRQLKDAGADGYILKNTGKNELSHAIMAIMEGKKYYSQEVQESLHKENINYIPVKLTKREIEIIKALAQGLTSIEIGDKLCISPHTVDSHRKNMLAKVKAKNTNELVRFALKNGFILEI